MNPYKPYSEDAFLIENETDAYSIHFRGVKYTATQNVTALGVLLFGLRPAGFNFRCKNDPAIAMQLMQHAAYILHLHANGDRHTQVGERRISNDDLQAWIAAAVDLAPDSESAGFVGQCIQEALGPWALCSDEEWLSRK